MMIKIEPAQNLCRRHSSDHRTSHTCKRHRNCCSEMTELIFFKLNMRVGKAVIAIGVINSHAGPIDERRARICLIRMAAVTSIVSWSPKMMIAYQKIIYSFLCNRLRLISLRCSFSRRDMHSNQREYLNNRL